MKKILFLMLFSSVVVFAGAQDVKKQNSNTKEAVISIPGYCCKGLNATIERTLAFERGVIEWKLDQPGKRVFVTYKTGRTDPDKIEKALAENGVRTANYKPNPRAIEKLPPCCQPAAKGEGSCEK